ncbi:MAG: type II toxin-antitoxin system VapC family toxin [Treponema sp.]|jgi:predicted nucleic acid-binding protein|nr:type II toxin-antitoxin system VapC family toxin [Treponema sp.]
MVKQKYVLDTNVFISFVKGLLGTTPAASLPMDGKIYISVITRIEALAYPQMTAKEEEKIRTVLRHIHVIPLNRKVEENTIRFRAKVKIKLPDSIISATAITLKAILLSNDSDLLKADWPGLVVRKV